MQNGHLDEVPVFFVFMIDKRLRQSISASGSLSRTSSMRARTSSSIFAARSSAFMFSRTCSGREAPVTTVLTSGFIRHQASAS